MWRQWISRGGFAWEQDGWPFWSHLHHAQSWWDWRHLPNVLLVHFNDLLADLPGDQRERLQDALGHNPMATPLVDVTPAELLQNYAGSAAEKKMLAWKSDPLKQHRAGLAVTALRAHLEQNSKTADVRRSNVARTSLGQLLPQLKERWALPLVETMKKLGITPIRPQ